MGAGSNRIQRTFKAMASSSVPQKTPEVQIPGTESRLSLEVGMNLCCSFISAPGFGPTIVPQHAVPPPPWPPFLLQGGAGWQNCGSLSSHSTRPPLPASAPPSLKLGLPGTWLGEPELPACFPGRGDRVRVSRSLGQYRC